MKTEIKGNAHPFEPLFRQANKMLIYTHLAIGDYAYQKNFFLKLLQVYPHLKLDLFIDDRRKTSDKSQWENLKNYTLYDWIRQETFFEKVYCSNYRPDYHRESIQKAQDEQYDIVFAITNGPRKEYARIANYIADSHGASFAIGYPTRFFELKAKKELKKLTGVIQLTPNAIDNSFHVTDRFNFWYEQLANIHLTEEECYPKIDIPSKWKQWAQNILVQKGQKKEFIFINPFSKSKRRTWPIEYVIKLIKEMQLLPRYKDCFFIINSVPENFEETQQTIKEANLIRTDVFSAKENFFQLPAILNEMKLIITVDTAIMHLANAVKTPVIALMRLKEPYWRPIDKDNSYVIFNEQAKHVLADIEPSKIIKALNIFPKHSIN